MLGRNASRCGAVSLSCSGRAVLDIVALYRSSRYGLCSRSIDDAAAGMRLTTVTRRPGASSPAISCCLSFVGAVSGSAAGEKQLRRPFDEAVYGLRHDRRAEFVAVA